MVLVSRQEAYDIRALVLVAPVSTTVRGFAVEVKVGKSEGLPKSGVINCDWIVTLPKTALEEKIGTLPAFKRRQLNNALRFSLGLDE